MYHSVSEISERNGKIRSTNPAYSLTVNHFREQMKCLYNGGYKTINLNQLLDINALVPEKSLVITFDDGWADNYRNVLPTLKEYDLTATIFVITGSVGQSNYMGWTQLREMSKAGFSIQSHTVSHKPLAGLNDDQLIHELTSSKKTIEDHIGTPVNFLSLPHGVFDRQVLATAQKVGYQAVCISEPGFAHEYSSPAVFRRINVSDYYTLGTFEKIIEKNRMTILPLILAKRLKNLLKRAIGTGNYRKLYDLRYTVRLR
jgi:peptidoglycan/xylan/chitin deacetylase (PgdA/CDA1 family)